MGIPDSHARPLRWLRRIGPTLLVACALLLAACGGGGDPFLEEYATTRPAEAALVGDYRLQWQTAVKTDPADVDLDRARLTLAADGTFRAVAVPIFRPINDGFAFDKVVDAQGRWQLAPHGAVADGDSFRNIWGVQFDGPLVYGFAYVTGRNAPHGLIIHTGAPTTGAVVYFARE